MGAGYHPAVDIEPLDKRDFDWILDHFDQFWPDEATRPRHHPIFINELADCAFVIRDGERVAAYLLGLIAQTSPTAYVHLVAVARDERRRGLARRLYENFVEVAKERGCNRLKATAAPWNELSIAFHLGFGMKMEGEETGGGIRVVRDYAGPGLDRVIFTRAI